MVSMETFGEIIRNAREKRGLFQRQVSESIDIDLAIICKFEKGERRPTKVQVEKIANFFGLDKEELVVAWLSDKIASYVIDEENGEEALKMAEEKVKYYKAINCGE